MRVGATVQDGETVVLADRLRLGDRLGEGEGEGLAEKVAEAEWVGVWEGVGEAVAERLDDGDARLGRSEGVRTEEELYRAN